MKQIVPFINAQNPVLVGSVLGFAFCFLTMLTHGNESIWTVFADRGVTFGNWTLVGGMIGFGYWFTERKWK